jgi:hypothetical protein
MRNIQKKIAVCACAFTLASCGDGNGNGKHDFLGFSPGMTKAQFDAAIKAQNGKCEPEDDDDHSKIPCETDVGKFFVDFADAVEGTPVDAVQIVYPDGPGTLEPIVDDISKQFGKRPDGKSYASGQLSYVVWKLGNGLEVSAATNASANARWTTLVNVDISQKNVDAHIAQLKGAGARARANHEMDGDDKQ